MRSILLPRHTPFLTFFTVFNHILLDGCGPFEIKRCGICRKELKCLKCKKDLDIDKTKIKDCPTKKVYVLVIGCHASRAIHLEMLQDRSTESFIMALKRFSNRRGRPSIIHSDNAGEYVSGRNTIQEVQRVLNRERKHQKLQDELT